MAEKKEKITKLWGKDIKSCLGCGANHDTPLNKDHYFPKMLLSLPGNFNPLRNPFRWMVMNRRNLFKLCIENCHRQADDKKMEALTGTNYEDFDPVGLVLSLRTYPHTLDSRYFEPMTNFKIQDHWNFINTVKSLKKEFDSDTIAKFNDAADASRDSIKELEIVLMHGLD